MQLGYELVDAVVQVSVVQAGEEGEPVRVQGGVPYHVVRQPRHVLGSSLMSDVTEFGGNFRDCVV